MTNAGLWPHHLPTGRDPHARHLPPLATDVRNAHWFATAMRRLRARFLVQKAQGFGYPLQASWPLSRWHAPARVDIPYLRAHANASKKHALPPNVTDHRGG